MTTNNNARRNVMKLLLAGSVVSMGTACSVLNSLPRGQGSTTDGTELALRVRDALRNHTDTGHLIVDITTKGDAVIIKGVVNSDVDVLNLDLVANRVEGVRHAQIDVLAR